MNLFKSYIGSFLPVWHSHWTRASGRLRNLRRIVLWLVSIV